MVTPAHHWLISHWLVLNSVNMILHHYPSIPLSKQIIIIKVIINLKKHNDMGQE